MKFPWIFAEKANHSVVRMCRVLGVSKSGYYAWTTREESVRSKANRALDEQVRKAHADSRGTYGSPRVHRALKKQAFPAGRHRVARAMRRLGIMARRRRRFVVTTRSDPSLGVAPDRVGRGFWPAALNAVVESFFASLKAESLADTSLPTRAEARTAVFDWLMFYNRTRMHSSLEYVSPEEFEYAAVKQRLAS